MMNTNMVRALRALPVVLALAVPRDADAQPVGTFRWQQQPYCNVMTLAVVQAGAIYELNGVDDQCGTSTRASVVGLAFLNPNGSIGLGLTIVTTPGGTPVHIDATIDIATVSGTWRDSGGRTGPWTFLAGPALGGSARPLPRVAFPAGLSAGNVTITNVGAPVGADDAATKSYVDTAAATTRGLIASPLNLTAYTAQTVGNVTTSSWGCMDFDPAAPSSLRLELPLPIGAVMTGMRLKYRDTAPNDFTIYVRAIEFPEGGIISDGIPSSSTSSNGTNGNRLEQVTFGAPLPPVTSTHSYYLFVQALAHTGIQSFCGVEPLYTLP